MVMAPKGMRAMQSSEKVLTRGGPEPSTDALPEPPDRVSIAEK